MIRAFPLVGNRASGCMSKYGDISWRPWHQKATMLHAIVFVYLAVLQRWNAIHLLASIIMHITQMLFMPINTTFGCGLFQPPFLMRTTEFSLWANLFPRPQCSRMTPANFPVSSLFYILKLCVGNILSTWDDFVIHLTTTSGGESL